MFQFGRTIFYDKKTGLVLYESGDVETTLPDYRDLVDFYGNIKALKERDRESIGELILEFGQYAEDYAAGGFIERIDMDKRKPLFTYREPGQPQDPVTPRLPISEQLTNIQRQIETLAAKAAALADGQEMHDDAIAEVVMHIYE